jgi:hypothetical protein
VETAALLSEGPLATVVAHDFASIKGVGFDTVLLRHLDAAELPTLLAAAEGASLNLIVPDQGAIDYVRGGIGAPPWFDIAGVPDHARIAGRFVGHVVDEITLKRAVQLAEAGHAMRPRIAVCAVVRGRELSDTKGIGNAFDYLFVHDDRVGAGESLEAGESVGVAVVQCRYSPDERGSAVRAWLRNYHAALLAGRFGGVMFDAYQVLPGRWEAISTGGQRLSPERVTMLKRIVSRAERWRPMLAGLRRQLVSSAFGDHADLSTAVFGDDKRRCLLLVNTSADRFVRTDVSVPADIGSRPIQRAVRVADADAAPAGEVIEARRSMLQFHVDLAPGDAALYELF